MSLSIKNIKVQVPGHNARPIWPRLSNPLWLCAERMSFMLAG